MQVRLHCDSQIKSHAKSPLRNTSPSPPPPMKRSFPKPGAFPSHPSSLPPSLYLLFPPLLPHFPPPFPACPPSPSSFPVFPFPLVLPSLPLPLSFLPFLPSLPLSLLILSFSLHFFFPTFEPERGCSSRKAQCWMTYQQQATDNSQHMVDHKTPVFADFRSGGWKTVEQLQVSGRAGEHWGDSWAIADLSAGCDGESIANFKAGDRWWSVCRFKDGRAGDS